MTFSAYEVSSVTAAKGGPWPLALTGLSSIPSGLSLPFLQWLARLCFHFTLHVPCQQQPSCWSVELACGSQVSAFFFFFFTVWHGFCLLCKAMQRNFSRLVFKKALASFLWASSAPACCWTSASYYLVGEVTVAEHNTYTSWGAGATLRNDKSILAWFCDFTLVSNPTVRENCSLLVILPSREFSRLWRIHSSAGLHRNWVALPGKPMILTLI